MLNKYNKRLLEELGVRDYDERYYDDHYFSGADTLLMHVCCISGKRKEDVEGKIRNNISRKYLLKGDEGNNFRALYPSCMAISSDYIFELIKDLEEECDIRGTRSNVMSVVKKYITTDRDITLVKNEVDEIPRTSSYNSIIKIILAYNVQSRSSNYSRILSERILESESLFELLSENRRELIQDILKNIKYVEKEGFLYLIETVLRLCPDNIDIDAKIKEYSNVLYDSCYAESLEYNKAKYKREIVDSEVIVFSNIYSSEFTSFNEVDNEYLYTPRDEFMEAIYHRIVNLCAVLEYGNCFPNFEDIVNEFTCLDLVDSSHCMLKLIKLFNLPVDIACQVNYYILSDIYLRNQVSDWDKEMEEHKFKNYSSTLSRMYDTTLDDESVLELQKPFYKERLLEYSLREREIEWKNSGDLKYKYVPRFIELRYVEDIIDTIRSDNSQIKVPNTIARLDGEIESRLGSYLKYKDLILRLLKEFDYITELCVQMILDAGEVLYEEGICFKEISEEAESIYSLILNFVKGDFKKIHNKAAADLFFQRRK